MDRATGERRLRRRLHSESGQVGELALATKSGQSHKTLCKQDRLWIKFGSFGQQRAEQLASQFTRLHATHARYDLFQHISPEWRAQLNTTIRFDFNLILTNVSISQQIRMPTIRVTRKRSIVAECPKTRFPLRRPKKSAKTFSKRWFACLSSSSRLACQIWLFSKVNLS